MKIADFRRFKAIMERTTSEIDPEALAAIRAANRLLQVEGLTWTRVLDRSVQVLGEVEEAPIQPRRRPNPEDDMEEYFARAMENAKGSFLKFLESVHEQYERTGWISPAQRDDVIRAAERS